MNNLGHRFSVAAMMDWNESSSISTVRRPRVHDVCTGRSKKIWRQPTWAAEVKALQCQRRADVSGGQNQTVASFHCGMSNRDARMPADSKGPRIIARLH